MPTWIYDDGGRAAAGFKGETRDCVTRAIAIATGIPYAEVYKRLNAFLKADPNHRAFRKAIGLKVSDARRGVLKPDTRRFLESLGWTWTPTMGIGTGATVHLRADELPGGTLIVKLSKHVCAVVDGVIRDTHDPSRGGTRCVYGYWRK